MAQYRDRTLYIKDLAQPWTGYSAIRRDEQGQIRLEYIADDSFEHHGQTADRIGILRTSSPQAQGELVANGVELVSHNEVARLEYIAATSTMNSDEPVMVFTIHDHETIISWGIGRRFDGERTIGLDVGSFASVEDLLSALEAKLKRIPPLGSSTKRFVANEYWVRPLVQASSWTVLNAQTIVSAISDPAYSAFAYPLAILSRLMTKFNATEVSLSTTGLELGRALDAFRGAYEVPISTETMKKSFA